MNDGTPGAARPPTHGDTAPQPHTVVALIDGPDNQMVGTWPDRVVATVSRAELHCYTAAAPRRARVLLFVGGGYVALAYDREGAEVAAWLVAAGYEVCVVVHRLPGAAVLDSDQKQPFDIALTDARLALAQLATMPPLPLLIMGLSSGGHLAGVLACQPEARHAMGLLVAYAPINANHRDHKAPAGKPDYPPPEKQAFYDAWPIGLAEHPQGLPPQPVFLAYALHDSIVPVEHALNFIRSARDAKLQLDAHVFNDAPHGFALRELAGSHAHWPALALSWMESALRRGTATAAPNAATGSKL